MEYVSVQHFSNHFEIANSPFVFFFLVSGFSTQTKLQFFFSKRVDFGGEDIFSDFLRPGDIVYAHYASGKVGVMQGDVS